MISEPNTKAHEWRDIKKIIVFCIGYIDHFCAHVGVPRAMCVLLHDLDGEYSFSMALYDST